MTGEHDVSVNVHQFTTEAEHLSAVFRAAFVITLALFNISSGLECRTALDGRCVAFVCGDEA